MNPKKKLLLKAMGLIMMFPWSILLLIGAMADKILHSFGCCLGM